MFIRELFGQNATQAFAEFFTRKLARGALEIQADKLEAIGLAAAKTLDGKSQPCCRMVGDGQHASRQVVLLGPEMKKGLSSGTAHLPRHSEEGNGAAACLAHFNGGGIREF